MSKLNEASEAVQCWLADDCSCGGKVRDILKWWLFLKTVGPKFGYFPKATKCWLIVKPDKFEEAKSALTGQILMLHVRVGDTLVLYWAQDHI